MKLKQNRARCLDCQKFFVYPGDEHQHTYCNSCLWPYGGDERSWFRIIGQLALERRNPVVWL